MSAGRTADQGQVLRPARTGKVGIERGERQPLPACQLQVARVVDGEPVAPGEAEQLRLF